MLDERWIKALHVQALREKDLHVELPPSVDLADPGLAGATHEAVELVERG